MAPRDTEPTHCEVEEMQKATEAGIETKISDALRHIDSKFDAKFDQQTK